MASLNTPIVPVRSIEYPKGTVIQQDTGFQGYAPEGVIIKQPKKKPRGGELTVEEKEANRELSRVRVVIEHLISGAKRLRLVKEEMRLKVENISDDEMEIACGMHNLRNLMRKPFFKKAATRQQAASSRQQTVRSRVALTQPEPPPPSCLCQ